MSVVACPKCQEKVTLPAKAPPATKVRCPLCSENYELSEALALAPPTLEIVEYPEGYDESYADNGSLAASSFSQTIDRPVPTNDDEESDFDLKLEGDDAAVATEDAPEARFDQWGSMSSSTPAHELGEPQVRREALPVRRKKKGPNPLIHIVGIVLGGALAFPAAFLILLWLPGTWRRDPANIGPWLAKNAPFLVPADLRKEGSSLSENTATQTAANTAAGKVTKAPPVKSEPGKAMDLGSKFDNALNGTGTSAPAGVKNDLPMASGFIGGAAETESGPDSLADLMPTDDEPKLDGFALPTTDTDTSPTLTDTSGDVVAEKPSADSVDPQLEAEPALPSSEPAEPVVASTDDPKTEPATVEPTNDIATYATDLAPAREAFVAADEAFNKAGNSAEKKSTAVSMYQAAADLAAKLPADAASPGPLGPLATDAMKLQFVGVYSAVWIDKADRSSEGIVLSGKVKSCQTAGTKFELHVELPSREKREVIVIAPQQCEVDQRVFIAGVLVPDAKSAVAGYEGDATQAIDARVVQAVP